MECKLWYKVVHINNNEIKKFNENCWFGEEYKKYVNII